MKLNNIIASKVFRFEIWFLFLPLLAHAQLKEIEVSEMPSPEVSVVQANVDFPENALLLIYSSLDNLNFRSSMGAINKQSYNPKSNRYEVLINPVKQIVFVYASGYIESKIGTINPNPKDIFYFKVEDKKTEITNSKPGVLKIFTEPKGCEITLNGIKIADKTPFTGELNDGNYRIKLLKAKYEILDTVVFIKPAETAVLNINMKPTTLWININSQPNGAEVTLAGQKKGTTPSGFELDLTDKNLCGSQSITLILPDHETINETVYLKPSISPLELNYIFKKKEGSFSIISDPEDAQVFINGQLKGNTPLSGILPLGNYEVAVKLEGYSAYNNQITITESRAASFTIKLTEPQEEGVSVESQNHGGFVVYENNGHGLVAGLADLGKFSWIGAKAACDNLVLNGYSDWRLPSKDELYQLYINRFTIGGFDNLDYWSSTESGYNLAWNISFSNGNQFNYIKTYQNNVRAVRDF